METESSVQFFYLSLSGCVCASYNGILRLRLIETEVLKQYDQMGAITMTVMSFCEINCKFQILQLVSLFLVLVAFQWLPQWLWRHISCLENTLRAEISAIRLPNVEPVEVELIN